VTPELTRYSFVVKKKGLLISTTKSGNLAGEGHAYLKSWVWWTGMTMMVVGTSTSASTSGRSCHCLMPTGEICNFVA
jgi:hypothetical protein